MKPAMTTTKDRRAERARTDRRAFLGLGAGALAGCVAGGPQAGEAAGAGARDEDERVALDELFADLTDQSGLHAPIEDGERAARRARLASLLGGAGVDALIVEPGATLAYLAGVEWGLSERLFALAVLADGTCFWISPAFEEERARQRTGAVPGDVVTWNEHEYAFRPLAAALAARGCERVAVEPRARLFVAEGLAEALGPERLASARALVRELRGAKDAHELALLRAVNEL